MSINEKLMEDMKAAMKSGDKLRLETIRGLRSQFKNTQIEKKRELTEEEEIQVLMSAAKKRKESIELFRSGNRPERAAEEEKELEIIQQYLPAQMGMDEVAELVNRVIQDIGAVSIKDMGKVMGKMMPLVKGKADGKLVQEVVQKRLASL